MKKIRAVVLAISIFLTMLPSASAYSSWTGSISTLEKPVAKYTAPDGLQVISFSGVWAEEEKLKSLYLELLQNYHGEELKLLSKIYIYPGASGEGESLAGHWFGSWHIDKGKYALLPDRYIYLYYGDTIKDVAGFARTLSHEYGHHFTYYHYFQKERTSWDDWRESYYAKARGIFGNPFIGSGYDIEHTWQIEEIAADDYVQLFGSPNAKRSQLFQDIEQRAQNGALDFSFSSQTYNLSPQGNPFLSLAANAAKAREYWLQAATINSVKQNQPPTASKLSLDQIKDIGINTNQYVFTWTAGWDEKNADLEYTLVHFDAKDLKTGEFSAEPVKTVKNGAQLRAVYGAVLSGRNYYWDVVTKGVKLFTVYSKDSDGLIVSSNTLAIDFKDPDTPDFVSILPEELNAGTLFKPRVKLNGRQLTFDSEPIIVKGTTMVPFRQIFSELGAEVNWDEREKKVTANKNGIEIILTVGEDSAYINGEAVSLAVPVMIRNGRTMIPMRLVSEALGAQVQWNQSLQLVSIDA